MHRFGNVNVRRWNNLECHLKGRFCPKNSHNYCKYILGNFERMLTFISKMDINIQKKNLLRTHFWIFISRTFDNSTNTHFNFTVYKNDRRRTAAT